MKIASILPQFVDAIGQTSNITKALALTTIYRLELIFTMNWQKYLKITKRTKLRTKRSIITILKSSLSQRNARK